MGLGKTLGGGVGVLIGRVGGMHLENISEALTGLLKCCQSLSLFASVRDSLNTIVVTNFLSFVPCVCGASAIIISD